MDKYLKYFSKTISSVNINHNHNTKLGLFHCRSNIKNLAMKLQNGNINYYFKYVPRNLENLRIEGVSKK